MQNKKVAIVGAGPVGTLMSIYLALRGYKVTLFEKREDLRKENNDSGRSINLALSNRGWWPLREIGLEDTIKKMVVPMHGRMMHDENGALNFQPYGREGEYINSISRSGLNELLLNTAEKNGVKIQFNCQCTHVDFERNILHFEVGGNNRKIETGHIIGADGAFSRVRACMQKTDRFNYAQHYIEHGYKELSIPANPDSSFKINKNALHIWPRGNFMLIALPNQDGSFTCTLFFPFEGEQSFESLKSDNDIQQFFLNTFPDAAGLIPDLINEFHQNPASSLVTIKSYPWIMNNTLIIGDAAHAIVPFYGQGMNCGFEDCRILNDLLDKHEDNWQKTITEFQENRKQDTDAISDLALHNFIEMRDLVADENFRLRKKIEAKLHELYPKQWIPLYSMVTFNEKMSYSKALEKGGGQKKIMDEVMSAPGLSKRWEELDYQEIINRL